jgi:aerobic-type carbon monoxide dehydrogenase small subunit (CoxS/CutS family)
MSDHSQTCNSSGTDLAEQPTRSEHELSRRAFLEGTGAAIVAATALTLELDAQAPAAPEPSISADPQVPRTTIRWTINGVAQRVEVEDRWTLAELLRDRLALTGTKIGCDRGECGACTVLIDDAPVYSCSQLALWMDGREVTTVEGLARNGTLSPLQQAFVEKDAPQCGFCTSGQLMTATALLRTNPRPTTDQVRSAMAGNICRCANYNRLVEAVTAASLAMAATRSQGGAL